MTIDVFVHPEFAIKNGYPDCENYDRYLSSLESVYEAASSPILIDGFSRGEFDSLFAPERVVKSMSHFVCEYPIDQGEVSRHEWDKFVDLIGDNCDFRVHGSYLGECTEGFSVQLFAHLVRGEFWNNGEREEKELRRQHELNGDFLRAGVKYGVVLDPGTEEKVINPRRLRLPFRRRYPHGNITYQLIDDETVVY